MMVDVILLSSQPTVLYEVPYSRVCGMVIGYQKGTTDVFQPSSNSVDYPYVNGVSITYGTLENIFELML